MRMIEVEWLDSVSHCGSPWRSKDELEKSSEAGPCFTAGYLFREDDKQLTVLLSHGGPDDDAEVGMAITIPKVCVQAVHDLTRVYEPIVLT